MFIWFQIMRPGSEGTAFAAVIEQHQWNTEFNYSIIPLFTINLCVLMFQMGNASDTSAVFASTISKEHDILMGSLYIIFCKSTQQANLCYVDLLLTSCLTIPEQVHNLQPSSISLLFFFTGILSLMGNCILLLVAYHKRSTLKPAEFFIINLSISDLGMTLSLFPLAIPSAFSHRYLLFYSTSPIIRNIKFISQ